MRICAKRRPPRIGKQLAKFRRAGKVSAQHQRIREVPDQVFHFGSGPARDGRPDRYIGLARVPPEQRLERGQQRLDQCRAFSSTQRVQRVGEWPSLKNASYKATASLTNIPRDQASATT